MRYVDTPDPSVPGNKLSPQGVVLIDPVTGQPVSPNSVTLTGPVTVSNEVEIKNDSGNPVPVTDTRLPSALGQALMAGSLPVVIASDQSSVVVSGGAASGSAPTHPPVLVSGIDAGGLKRSIKTDSLGNVGFYSASDRATAAATIANAASVSGTIDLLGTALVGFVMPSAWTAAALNLEVSIDNATWSSPYDSAAAAVCSIATPLAGAAYSVDAISLLPWRYVRFRSGTTGSPVNQGAARTINYVTRPLS